MAGWSDCLKTIEAAAGRKLSDDELDTLLSALQARQRYLQAKGIVADSGQAALQAAEQVAQDLKMHAIIEKRNAAINRIKRAELTQWVQQHFGNNMAEGLEAILVGVNRAKSGARTGAAQLQESLKRQYLAGLTADLEKSGTFELVASGSADRDIARALWALGRGEDTAHLPKEVVNAAKAINKWQEASRLDGNKAGAWIGKYEGYIVRQSHDSEKIRRAGFDTWRADALQHFDLPRMTGESGTTDADKMLRGIYNDLAAGNHEHLVPDPTGFKGPGNIAKRLSQSRTIHFTDADAWFDYNKAFGTGNLRESVVKGLSHSADSIGLMQKLGPNPKAMFESLRSEVALAAKDAGKVDAVAKLDSKRARLDMMMSAVDGSMNIPGSQLWARRSANIRAVETMAKLGSVVFSQLNDLAVFAAGTKYQGRGFLSGMAEAAGGIGRNLSKGDTRQLASSLGVVLDNMSGELGRIGSFSEAGTMTGLQRSFMKYNLFNWWTNRMRASAALGTSHYLAQNAEHAFEQLSPDLQRLLSVYDIKPGEWDGVRGAVRDHTDGRAYIVPEHIEDKALGDKLRNLYVDQTNYLALEPDTRSRAVMLQGTRPGTFVGEMARFVTQFKSWTVAYMQKVIGRELYGKGYEGDSVLGALQHGNGEFMGLTNLILWSTLFGYGSMVMKDLAKGRSPRDPTQSPADAAKIFAAAMVQGGGAGIYGDFLFGSASRMGGGTIETLGGPVISDLGRFVDLYHRALHGDDVKASAFQQMLNDTPFVNLFYTRLALDYALFYRIQESLNPGYLRRMERRVEKENAQTFLLRPSSIVQ